MCESRRRRCAGGKLGGARQVVINAQFDLVKDSAPPCIGHIDVRLNDDLPKLLLRCQRERSFELAISPKGQRITLTS